MLPLRFSQNRIVPIIVAGTFFSLLIAAFFLAQTGLNWETLAATGVMDTIEILTSLNFIFFTAFVSLTLGFACLSAYKLELRKAMLVVLAGSLPAGIISVFVFPSLFDFLIILIGIPVPLMAMTWNSHVKLGEMKKLTLFRSYTAGIGMFSLVLCIFVIISGIVVIYPQQDELLTEFEYAVTGKDFLEKTQREVVKANLESQFNLLADIHSSPEYKDVINMEDPRTEDFRDYYYGVMTNIGKGMNDPDWVLEGNSNLALQEIDLHQIMITSFPGWETISENFYLAFPMLVVTIIISGGNFVFRILGGGLGFLLSLLLKEI